MGELTYFGSRQPYPLQRRAPGPVLGDMSGSSSMHERSNIWRRYRLLMLGGPLFLTLLTGCTSGRAFWSYVIDERVDKPLPTREQGQVDKPPLLSPYNVKVVYNDGATQTQVLVPILTSGQQIIIDHQSDKPARALDMVPLPPTDADRELESLYLKRGLTVSQDAPPVSIVKTHETIRKHVRAGNDALALQYAETLLKRYPNHVKTLQIKGSLLFRMGEREAALEAYRRAQDVEPDRQVEEQIRKIESELAGEGP